jgi:hypothetical protein
MTTPSMKRQQWLEQAVADLRLLFRVKGYTIPDKMRLSVGFPKGSRGGHAIGQCWYPMSSKDMHAELFLSPTIDETTEVLATLAHELAHACLGPEAGHKSPFKRCAESVGLTGPMRATEAGPDFTLWVNGFKAVHGEYPGAKLDTSNMRKQSTRLIKVECSSCGYTARVTRKWIREAGAPICPTDEIRMEYNLGLAPEDEPMFGEGEDNV